MDHRRQVSPVPVELAATGPATIAAAATVADRVMLTVGADPARVAWGIQTARQARSAAGLDPATLRVGAYITLAATPSGSRPGHGPWQHGGLRSLFCDERRGGLGFGEDDAAVIGQIGRRYDEARHGMSNAAQAGSLDDEFIDHFAVAGTAAQCQARLHRLFELGLDRIVVVPGSRDTDPELLASGNALFADEVLPQLRTA